MLIIPVKEGENIDRALKRFKQYTKPSVKRRAEIQKAQYIQGLRDKEEL